MDNRRIEYDETNDLYRQMLWEAQRLEDKRLAKMITRRMTSRRHSIMASNADSKNVILFPMAPALCLPAEPEHVFWKQGQFWQDLVQFMFVLVFGEAWFLFFMHLLAKRIGM